MPKWKQVDHLLVIVILLIIAFSLVILISATATVREDPYYYVKRQLVWLGIGSIAFLFFLNLDYLQFKRFSLHLYLLNLGILAAVMFAGSTARGAQRWLSLGPFLFQPAEFAKVLFVISFAAYLSKKEGGLKTFRDLLPCFVYTALPVLLILKQPDLGTSLVFVAAMLGMLFMKGINPKLLLLLTGGGVAGAIFLLLAHFRFGLPLPLEDYQIMRFIVFWNPYADGQGGRGAGYHIIQSLIAIGSGGLEGKGFRQGTQIQLNFLPEHHTDFIFSVVGEEFGFLGASALLLLYFLLITRGIKIAAHAPDSFGCLLVSGILTVFLFHVLVNIGMTTGIMPVTGIPLPLFSYGGSSILANMIALGIIFNVSFKAPKRLF